LTEQLALDIFADVFYGQNYHLLLKTRRANLPKAIDLKISARVTVAGEVIPLGDGNKDFLASVPNLYAYSAYALTERFLFRYGGGWLSMKYKNYDRSLLVANFELFRQSRCLTPCSIRAEM
jgi:hypothetical protein